MSDIRFCKTLTKNDVGLTGSHQAGILIPKSNEELLKFLPKLNDSELNPSAWVVCKDDFGDIWRFRFVYYNNKFHSDSGTRNEYRMTHTTKFLKSCAALEGDDFIISKSTGDSIYRIAFEPKDDPNKIILDNKIKLSGWRRIF